MAGVGVGLSGWEAGSRACRCGGAPGRKPTVVAGNLSARAPVRGPRVALGEKQEVPGGWRVILPREPV